MGCAVVPLQFFSVNECCAVHPALWTPVSQLVMDDVDVTFVAARRSVLTVARFTPHHRLE